MNLPFKRLLKKEKEAPPTALVATEPRPAIEKPASERFGKTVMPKMPRAAEPEPTPVSSPRRSVSLGQEPAPAATLPNEPAAAARKPISLGQNRPAPRPNEPASAPLPPPVAPIRLPMPPAGNLPVPPIPAPASRPDISSNGTGAPVNERVPASGRSPVPISLPSPFAPVPARIKLPAVELAAAEAPPAVALDGPPIPLSLREVLRGLPPFQFTGEVESVPGSARIEFPFALVAPQLSLGRIAVSPAQFQAALPEEFRASFVFDEGGLPISLPLAEVLQHVPNESLALRMDQEEVAVANVFETPFSLQAAEDAERLHVPAGPIARDASEAEAAPGVPAIALAKDSLGEKAPERTPLQTLFETDDELDAKGVVAQVSRLHGVSACAIVFSDGLSLSGNIPPERGAERLCVIAPEVGRRLKQPMVDVNLGLVEAVTVFYALAPVSFFASGDICLTVLHSREELSAEIRARLARIAEELAVVFAQPSSLTPNA